MSTPLIELINVKKNYLNKTFNYSFTSNQVYLISGENGSGKSTLIKLIIGFIYADSGLVKRNIRNISYLAENQTLPQELTGYDYLKTIEKVYKTNINWEDYRQLFVCLDKKIKYLSKGNRQRIMLLETLFSNGKMIVLDEPFSGLDKKGTNDLIKLLKIYKNRGKTIIISSHKYKAIERLADIHIKL